MGSTIEIRRYNMNTMNRAPWKNSVTAWFTLYRYIWNKKNDVTSSLIGWAQSHNDPCAVVIQASTVLNMTMATWLS